MKLKKKLSVFTSLVVALSLSTAFLFSSSAIEYNSINDVVIQEENNDTMFDFINFEDEPLISIDDSNMVLRTTYNAGWTIPANKSVKSTTYFNMLIGDYFRFDLTYTPALSSSDMRIGIYNKTTDTYRYFSHNAGSLTGNVDITTNGSYCICFENKSSQSVTFGGTYVPVIFIQKLNVPLYSQATSTWCWAASSQMVAAYFGYSKTQDQIVAKVKGSSADRTGGSANDIKNAVEFATDNTYTTTASVSGSPVTFSAMATELSSGRPLIVRFDYSTGAHACVAVATDSANGYFKVNDPEPRVAIYKYSNAIVDSAYKYTQSMTLSTKWG